jgi:hypothetical protein
LDVRPPVALTENPGVYDTPIRLFNISDFSMFLEKLEAMSQVGLVEKGSTEGSAGIVSLPGFSAVSVPSS